MKKNIFLAVSLLVLSLVIVGCSRETALENNNENGDDEEFSGEINLGSGTQSGTYYPLGAALAKIWDDEVEDVSVSSQATDASVENMQLMKQGELDMGLTETGVLNEAYTGTGSFEDNEYEDVRVLASLYPQVVQIVAQKDAGIESFEDFEGEDFVPGAAGSATKNLADKVLDAYGMTEDDINAQYVGFSDVTDLMKDKQIAGGHILSGIPTSAVIEILSTANGELISLDQDEINSLTDENPELFKYTLDEDTYEEQEEDINTVSAGNVIAVPKDLPDDVVYDLTKAMWENIETIKENVPATEETKIETAAEELADVPLHPGAEKYYKEEGVLDEDD